MQIGSKIRFSTTHSDGSIITYKATVKKFASSAVGPAVWVEIPYRVRSLKFAPYDGKRFVQFTISQVEKFVCE